MCPGTLALVAAGASAAGSLVKGIGQAGAAGYQAQVAFNNSLVERRNAQHAAEAGAAQTEVAGLKSRAQLANVRAGQAAQGIDVNTGSAADVQTSQREIGGFETASVADRAAQAVYGYQARSTADLAQSRLDRAEQAYDYAGTAFSVAGDIAGAIPDIPGGSSIVSGASAAPSVPSQYQWMAGNQAGSDDLYEGFG